MHDSVMCSARHEIVGRLMVFLPGICVFLVSFVLLAFSFGVFSSLPDEEQSLVSIDSIVDFGVPPISVPVVMRVRVG